MEALQNYLPPDGKKAFAEARRYYTDTIKPNDSMTRMVNGLANSTKREKVVPELLCEVAMTKTHMDEINNCVKINNELIIDINCLAKYITSNDDNFTWTNANNYFSGKPSSPKTAREELLQLTREHHLKKSVASSSDFITLDRNFLAAIKIDKEVRFGYPRKEIRIFFEAARNVQKNELRGVLENLQKSLKNQQPTPTYLRGVTTFLTHLDKLNTEDMFRLYQQFLKIKIKSPTIIRAASVWVGVNMDLFTAAIKMCEHFKYDARSCQDVASCAGLIHFLSHKQELLEPLQEFADFYANAYDEYLNGKREIYNQIVTGGLRIYNGYRRKLTHYNGLQAVEHGIQHLTIKQKEVADFLPCDTMLIDSLLSPEHQRLKTQNKLYKTSIEMVQRFFEYDTRPKKGVKKIGQFGKPYYVK